MFIYLAKKVREWLKRPGQLKDAGVLTETNKYLNFLNTPYVLRYVMYYHITFATKFYSTLADDY